MILARSPLRITFGGGGTDLASYYKTHGGFLISAAINKYVYVSINRPFIEGIFLKYSEYEAVKSVEEVKHNIIREALILQNLVDSQIEITTFADIPAGTGLGSSGSFATALLKALYAFRNRNLLPEQLAELACHIEIDRLDQPIGKQDQYIAAVGGLTCFEFCKDDTVSISPLNISVDTLHDLEDNLLLFFTGYSRTASTLLSDQHSKSLSNDKTMIENLHYVKEIGLMSKAALEEGKTSLFGELMHDHWKRKRSRSAGMSNARIDQLYEVALENGANGGKLVGAGGGGFLLFYATDRCKLRYAMKLQNLEEVRFHFDFEGAKVVVS